MVKKRRRIQILEAQKNFRQRKKQNGQARVEFYFTEAAYLKLQENSKNEGMSQSEFLCQLLLNDKRQSASPEPMVVDNSVISDSVTKEELIVIVKKQRYWIERLQNVNDSLMNKI